MTRRRFFEFHEGTPEGSFLLDSTGRKRHGEHQLSMQTGHQWWQRYHRHNNHVVRRASTRRPDLLRCEGNVAGVTVTMVERQEHQGDDTRLGRCLAHHECVD